MAGRYPANCLIQRGPIRGRPQSRPFPRRAHAELNPVSGDCSAPSGTFPRVTNPSAARGTPKGKHRALDLHVSGLPPAFVLSQDQTLRLERRKAAVPQKPVPSHAGATEGRNQRKKPRAARTEPKPRADGKAGVPSSGNKQPLGTHARVRKKNRPPSKGRAARASFRSSTMSNTPQAKSSTTETTAGNPTHTKTRARRARIHLRPDTDGRKGEFV